MIYRIFVVSDSHRIDDPMFEALRRESGNYTHVIHLGDIEGNDWELKQELQRLNPLTGLLQVRGNCDYDSSVPQFRSVEFNGVRLFLAHGHRYINRVPGGPYDALASAAAGEGCAVALFGHTHRPADENAWNGVRLINPGSISLPRQEERKHGYGILTIAEDGKLSWLQKYIEDWKAPR